MQKTVFVLTALISVGAFGVRPAAATDLDIFTTIDYYLRSGIEDDIEDANTTAVVAAGTANGEVTTTNGIGGRIGARTLVDEVFDVGFSLGYVVGPEIESVLDTPAGRLTETTDTRFIRVMGEGGFHVRLADRVRLRLGAGAGLASAKVETEREASGTVTASANGSESKQGFTWELSPALVFTGEKLDVEVGARYAQFPKISETNDTPEIDWTPLGFYLGIIF
jgi:hypothetical protein